MEQLKKVTMKSIRMMELTRRAARPGRGMPRAMVKPGRARARQKRSSSMVTPARMVGPWRRMPWATVGPTRTRTRQLAWASMVSSTEIVKSQRLAPRANQAKEIVTHSTPGSMLVLLSLLEAKGIGSKQLISGTDEN